MVAYLQDSALDDERLASKLQEHRAKGVSIPLMHEAMQKWYYKDPQGEIQGRLFHPTLGLELYHYLQTSEGGDGLMLIFRTVGKMSVYRLSSYIEKAFLWAPPIVCYSFSGGGSLVKII